MAADSILIVATGADEFRTTGWRTGSWFSELTHGRPVTGQNWASARAVGQAVVKRLRMDAEPGTARPIEVERS